MSVCSTELLAMRKPTAWASFQISVAEKWSHLLRKAPRLCVLVYPWNSTLHSSFVVKLHCYSVAFKEKNSAWMHQVVLSIASHNKSVDIEEGNRRAVGTSILLPSRCSPGLVAPP